MYNELICRLDRIEFKLDRLLKGEVNLMFDLKALTDAVAAETTVEDSAIQLMNGLSTNLSNLIANSGNTVDPAAVQALVDGLNAEKDKLAAAIVANTPK